MKRVTMCALAVALLAEAASAADFHCPSGDAACLIAAIQTANSNGQPNTIFLEAGEYRLTAINNAVFDVAEAPNMDDGPNGLPSITGHITIRGPIGLGSTIARDDSASDFRIFHVEMQGNLTLSWVSLTGGRATRFAPPFGGGAILSHGTLSLNNSDVYNNVAFGHGGAISSHGGSLAISRSSVRNNQATFGSESFGGGIYSDRSAFIEDTSIQNNAASDVGGGIFSTGELLLLRSTVAGNSSFFTGGGIFATGTAWIEQSSILHNIAASQFPAGSGAGGVENGGFMTIASSTISNNRAAETGAGGVLNSGSSLVLRNVTVTRNSVGGGVGGLASKPRVSGGIVSVRPVRLENTILALNSDEQRPFDPAAGPSDCGVLLPPGSPGVTAPRSISSLGSNLIGSLAGCNVVLRSTDVVGNPLFGPFTEDEGRPGTGHFPLLEGSLGIDQGNEFTCTIQDQLGRPKVERCEIGAVEFQPAR